MRKKMSVSVHQFDIVVGQTHFDLDLNPLFVETLRVRVF